MATILLVEDHAHMRRALARELRRCGHSVREASNGGAEAMRLLDEVDIVVTDVFMPDQDGVELIQHVKKERPGTPVIVMSGGWHAFSSQAALEWGQAFGADATLEKPVSVDDINEAIRKFFKN